MFHNIDPEYQVCQTYLVISYSLHSHQLAGKNKDLKDDHKSKIKYFCGKYAD